MKMEQFLWNFKKLQEQNHFISLRVPSFQMCCYFDDFQFQQNRDDAQLVDTKCSRKFQKNQYLETKVGILPKKSLIYGITCLHMSFLLIAMYCDFLSVLYRKQGNIHEGGYFWVAEIFRVTHFPKLASASASFMMIELCSTLCISSRLQNCI